MKCITLFLVLSLVVLMAEPGEAFIHHLFRGIVEVGKTIGKTIHGIVTGGKKQDLQEQQDQRMFERERAFN
ncbi:pteroicidin-alpha [Lates calcarifer]|uniref:Pteroicidin-alpha n=1 Tax=Lates calcarifer TaxID=8187 RepID=A0A4W6DEI7_LATCA|nr:pteroicidin-alpha [Lates calcarifer]